MSAFGVILLTAVMILSAREDVAAVSDDQVGLILNTLMVGKSSRSQGSQRKNFLSFWRWTHTEWMYGDWPISGIEVQKIYPGSSQKLLDFF